MHSHCFCSYMLPEVSDKTDSSLLQLANRTGIVFPTDVSRCESHKESKLSDTIPEILHFSTRLKSRPTSPKVLRSQGAGSIHNLSLFVRRVCAESTQISEFTLRRNSRAQSMMATCGGDSILRQSSSKAPACPTTFDFLFQRK